MSKVDELPVGIEILASPGENRGELLDAVATNLGRIVILWLALLIVGASFFVGESFVAPVRLTGIMTATFVLFEFLPIFVSIASLMRRNPWVPRHMLAQVIIMTSLRIYLQGVTSKQLRKRVSNVDWRIRTLRSYLETAKRVSPEAVSDVMRHTRLLEVGPARMRLNEAIYRHNENIRTRDMILEDAARYHCRDLVRPLVLKREFAAARGIVVRASALLAQAEQLCLNKQSMILLIRDGKFDDAQLLIDRARAYRSRQSELDGLRARIMKTETRHHKRLLASLKELEQLTFGSRDYRMALYALTKAIDAAD